LPARVPGVVWDAVDSRISGEILTVQYQPRRTAQQPKEDRQ
jgi:hypothetical protein